MGIKRTRRLGEEARRKVRERVRFRIRFKTRGMIAARERISG
jgi:hypothetical protein